MLALATSRRAGRRAARPPPAAPELTRMSWDDYSAHLLLAIALTLGFVFLASTFPWLPWLPALAGALAVPIVIFQHDVRHLHHSNTTFEEKLSDALVLITGTCYGILPWSGVHVAHHAATGSYQGALVAPVLRGGADGKEGKDWKEGAGALGDLDDLAGLLRNGNPFGPESRRHPLLRGLVAASCIALTVSLFQGMFMLQSLLGPWQPSGAKDEQVEVIRKGAVLTLAHLCMGVFLLGIWGYAMYSVGLSACLTLLTAPVHDARGVHSGGGGYYEQQVRATANIAEHGSPLIQYFMMGNDYHIEHHLWPRVPGTKKEQLAASAKHFCLEHGLPYREVTLTEAWQSWAAEAWRLAGEPFESPALHAGHAGHQL